MTRSAIVFGVVALAFCFSSANAQFPVVPGPPIYGGFGPYAGYGGYPAFGPYGGTYFGYAGLGGAGYGPLLYSQQLFQQQALATQQVFQQQQQAIVSQVQLAQSRLQTLESTKQQLLKQYLAMSDSDKAAVRAGLTREFLSLDAYRREGWKRDEAIRTILGADLPRLASLAQLQGMSEADKDAFRQRLRAEYRLLSPTEQNAWQKDEALKIVLGNDWWLK